MVKNYGVGDGALEAQQQFVLPGKSKNSEHISMGYINPSFFVEHTQCDLYLLG